MKRFLRKLREGGGAWTWSVETIARAAIVREDGKALPAFLFDDPAECERWAERELAARLASGWFEVAEHTPAQEVLERRDYFRARYAALTGAPPDPLVLRQHFSFLCDTEACGAVLARVLEHVRLVRVNDWGALELVMASPAGILRCAPTAELGVGSVPDETLRRMLGNHRALAYHPPGSDRPAALLQTDFDFTQFPGGPLEPVRPDARLVCHSTVHEWVLTPSGEIFRWERDPPETDGGYEGEALPHVEEKVPWGIGGVFLRVLLEAVERDLAC